MWRTQVRHPKINLRDPVGGGPNYFSFSTRSLPWDPKYLAWKLEAKFVFIANSSAHTLYMADDRNQIQDNAYYIQQFK
jgi:hypothetical protein